MGLYAVIKKSATNNSCKRTFYTLLFFVTSSQHHTLEHIHQNPADSGSDSHRFQLILPNQDPGENHAQCDMAAEPLSPKEFAKPSTRVAAV